MNQFFRKLVVLISLLTVSFGSFATETLTLEQLRQEVLDDNVDVKIQYEKYYQAQQNVRVKLGEFLPRLDFQVLYWNNTFSLLNSLVPTPSGWFVYEASKEMAIAEKYITDALKLNILKELTLSYIQIKHQQEIIASMLEEEKKLRKVYDKAVSLYTIGQIERHDVFTAERALLQHQQQIFVLDSVMIALKESLLLSIDRDPKSEVVLAAIEQNTDVLPETVEEAIEMALANAPELKANIFMAEGARHMTQAARWSFISFNGIGLGYPAALRIEKSKQREIALKGEKIANEISNQVSYAYTKLANIEARIETQKDLIAVAEVNLMRVRELYEGGQATLEELLKAQQALLVEQRGLVLLEQDKAETIALTKRLLGLDAALNDYDLSAYENADLTVNVNTRRLGKTRVTADINIADSLKDQIVSVVYEGDLFNNRVLNISGNLSLTTKVKGSGVKTVKATILLVTGETVELITSVTL